MYIHESTLYIDIFFPASRARKGSITLRSEHLHCVADEAHDGEADGAGDCNLLELLGIWLGAALDQAA